MYLLKEGERVDGSAAALKPCNVEVAHLTCNGVFGNARFRQRGLGGGVGADFSAESLHIAVHGSCRSGRRGAG